MGELASTFGLDLSHIIIQMVNFAVVLLGLWWFLYKPALALIDERRAKIAQGVEDAARAETRLTEIEGERTDIIATATTEANTILGNAKQRAREQSEALLAHTQERSDAQLAATAAQAEEMKAKALRESREEIGKAAVLAAAKVLKEK